MTCEALDFGTIMSVLVVEAQANRIAVPRILPSSALKNLITLRLATMARGPQQNAWRHTYILRPNTLPSCRAFSISKEDARTA
jgi:hypothetical protein